MNAQKLEHVRTGIALLGALITGGAALYGVYAKGRTESRQDTQASYETLAPEVNELKSAIQELRAENQALRARVDPPAPEKSVTAQEPAVPPVPPRSSGQARMPERRKRLPAASPQEKPTVAAEAPAPAAGAPTPAEPPVPEQKRPDTTDTGEKKLPVDFETAAEIWKRVKEYRKQQQTPPPQ